MSFRQVGAFLLAFSVGYACNVCDARSNGEFVTLDPETKYLKDADGLFCGFGMNYNQVLDGKLHASPYAFDLDILEDDLSQIARMGFTHVVFRMQWGYFVEGEGRDPEAAYAKWEEILDRVGKHGLYAQIWFDSWVWPGDMTLDDKFNIVIVDEFWRRYLEWVSEVTAHFKDNKVIMAWRSENESLGVRTQARHAQHPALLGRFRDALGAHYRTVEKLNEAWGTGYAGFDEVKLPMPEDDATAKLIDYNILLHEPFVIARNQELARVVRKSDPNHLLFISGIGAIGGRVGGLFEIHDIDKLTGFDVCGNGLYGDFPPQGVGSLLHHARTIRKFISYGKPAMITEVGISHSEGHPLRQLQKEWVLAHFADALGAGGTVMDIWDYTWITDPRGNYRSTDNVACRGVREFLQKAGRQVFAQESARVLILRSKAEDYGNWPWRSHGNAQMVGDFLYQMHVPYDVITDANVTPERLRKYAFIFVPSQTVLIEEPVWRMIDNWLRSGTRGMAIGYIQPQSRTLQPTSLPPAMAGLVGLDPDAAHDVIGFTEPQVLSVVFSRSFGPFQPGDVLNLNPGAHSELWDMPREWASSARVVATIKTGDNRVTPALVENRLPNGSSVYCTAFTGGLVPWAINHRVTQPTFDNMVPLYAEMLSRVGVAGEYDAPRSLGVYISKDDSTVIVKERMGRSTTDLLRSERLGRSLFSEASITLKSGEPALLSAELPPRGVRIFRRLPITVTDFTGRITARAWEFDPEYVELEISGKGPLTIALGGLKPEREYQITSVASPSHRLAGTQATSDTKGMVVLKRDLDGMLSLRIRAEKVKK